MVNNKVLTSLNLEENEIGDEGARALSAFLNRNKNIEAARKFFEPNNDYGFDIVIPLLESNILFSPKNEIRFKQLSDSIFRFEKHILNTYWEKDFMSNKNFNNLYSNIFYIRGVCKSIEHDDNNVASDVIQLGNCAN